MASSRSITSSARHAFAFGGEAQHQAVAEHGLGQGLDVLEGHVGAAVQQRPGLGAEDQELHGPRARSPAELLARRSRARPARRTRVCRTSDERVADHVVGDRHLADDPLQLEDLLGRQHRLDRVAHHRRSCPPGDLELLVEARVLHEDLEHEAVLLGLGQRIGPFLLDRVLRGQHEERVGQLVPHAAHGHLPLLHGLQQGGLGLGRRAVDLVGQDHVARTAALAGSGTPGSPCCGSPR